jgi:glyoxylase-like metal-dependent hydrolase (beta-lactamase superfamily II)
MESLQIGKYKMTWLQGGVTHLDGGAMFGVVPKPLWSKKYPHNDTNQIELRTDPILIQGDGITYLIESGIGVGKLSDKQKRNFGVLEESSVEQSLASLGLTTSDIDYVIMTHMHYDHANGLTKKVNGEFIPVFPNSKIITSQIEWDEMREPNIRSRNTYWKENWEPIQNQVETFDEEWTHGPLKMVHTGGHSDGHSIVILEDGGETALHMADIMPTHAHQNVLWVMAYDDYPMNSIAAKQKWLEFGLSKNAWFTFYHDAIYRAVKWDNENNFEKILERKK